MKANVSPGEITDYILRITREIWEDGNPDLVPRYYAPEARIHALGGIMRGAAEVTANTRAMQTAFPDRLVIGEDVVCSPLQDGAWLSSHRIRSPMTSLGKNMYGPATGRKVTAHVFADCVVKDGMIQEEWLTRDNLGLVRQLGYDPLEVAQREAGRIQHEEHRHWLMSERDRVLNSPQAAASNATPDPVLGPKNYTRAVLLSLWQGASDFARNAYAPYAVLTDSGDEIAGAGEILQHFSALKKSLVVSRLSVDHAGVQARGKEGLTLAARWTAAAKHTQTFEGLEARGAPLFLIGITHWWLTGERIAREWTVFDRLALMEQILRHAS